MNDSEIFTLLLQSITTLGGVVSTILICVKCFHLLLSKHENSDKVISALKASNEQLRRENEKNSEQIRQLTNDINKLVNKVDLSESDKYETN